MYTSFTHSRHYPELTTRTWWVQAPFTFFFVFFIFYIFFVFFIFYIFLYFLYFIFFLFFIFYIIFYFLYIIFCIFYVSFSGFLFPLFLHSSCRRIPFVLSINLYCNIVTEYSLKLDIKTCSSYNQSNKTHYCLYVMFLKTISFR